MRTPLYTGRPQGVHNREVPLYTYLHIGYSLFLLEKFLPQTLWQQVVDTPVCEEDVVGGGQLPLGLVRVVLCPEFVQWDNLGIEKKTRTVYEECLNGVAGS